MTQIAIVGLGNAARTIWTPALHKLPGVSLVAGADPDTSAQAAWSKGAPSASPHGSLKGLLECHQGIEWLVVATPPEQHAADIRAGLQAGCHVLCEKPVSPSLSDFDALLAVAAQAGRTLTVNHEFTHMPIFAAVLENLQGGGHGPLRFAQVWQQVNDGDSTGWRGAGETLREFGTHGIDLLLQAFGGAPCLVTARMPRPDPSRRGDPVDLVTLEWPDGRAAHLLLNRLSPGEHRYMEARFDCTSASLRASIGGRAGLALRVNPTTRRPKVRLEVAGGGMAWVERGPQRDVIGRNGLHALVDATALRTQKIIDSVAAGQPQSQERVRDVLAVIDAAYRSAAADRSVLLT